MSAIEGAAVLVDAIPPDLRERCQWLVWRVEHRDGRPTKVPRRADDPTAAASTTDPATWGTFDAAAAAAHETDGIGFVLSPDDPFCGVDLDGCFAPTGELDSTAGALVALLDSYTERSPSGRGLHVLVRASLNGGRNRGRLPSGVGFEVYDAGRYFTVTGHWLRGTPAEILERQAELEEVLALVFPADRSANGRAAAAAPPPPAELDDEELLQRAFRARNGADLRVLFEGVWEDRYRSASEADLALVGGLAFWTGPDEDRLDRLFRRSRLMRPKWDSRRGGSTYGAETIARALAGRTEFYRPRAAATSAPPRGAAAVGECRDMGLDDIGNGARFADQHRGALRYVPAWNRWRRYDGMRLAEDDVLEHRRRAKETARRLAEEAAGEPDEQRRKAVLEHARRSAAEPRLRAMLVLAAADERIVVRPGDLDADPFALNTPSGIVDLRDGSVRRHRIEELVTMLTGAPYNPAAAAPLWEAHLRRCLVTREQIDFFQRLAGLSALGDTREHILAILYGSGANGKSVTVGALAGALGDYAHESTVDLILTSGRSPGQATPEVADLRGRRLVSVEETREDGQLASERVKWLTGGSTLRARHLHSNPFSFRPSHTLWVATNHKPRVGDDSHAIWRRIVLVPFAVTIPEGEWDRELPAKLAAQRPGILRWIVEGARAYLRDGLRLPATVTDATAAYREDEDVFGRFLTERTVAEEGASVQAAELLRAYNEWAAHDLSANALADKLQGRGFQRRRVKTGSRYFGLRLHKRGTLDD